jgi:hypothetical protein
MGQKKESNIGHSDAMKLDLSLPRFISYTHYLLKDMPNCTIFASKLHVM